MLKIFDPYSLLVSTFSTTLLGSFAISLLILSIHYWRGKSKPFPPGPKPYPIIGNIPHIPSKNSFLTFSRWRKTYGDIIGLRAPGQNIIVLNSRQVVETLLNQRGSIYSDRPPMPMVTAPKWINMPWALVALRYGDQLHLQRRIMSQCLNPKACQVYHPPLKFAALEFAQRLIESPDEFVGHIRVYAAAAILRVVYGHRVTSIDDRYMRDVEEQNRESRFLPPLGTHLVDFFPILTKFDPSIFGRKLSNRVKRLAELGVEIRDAPYEEAKSKLIQGTALENSMISGLIARGATHLESGSEEIEGEHVFKDVMAQALIAGDETTSAAIQRFIIAMMLHPQVQQKARKAVSDLERLPEIGDQESLPYVQAIYLEVLRWGAITPLGVPHYTTENDVYNGMFIPKGSLILPNMWECLNDPHDYPNPEKFLPERFMMNSAEERLATDFVDPRSLAFGFGRRICPGRYLADATVWMAMVTILYLFDINKPADGMEPDLEPDAGFLVNFPKPFRCRIIPQSCASIEFVKSALKNTNEM